LKADGVNGTLALAKVLINLKKEVVLIVALKYEEQFESLFESYFKDISQSIVGKVKPIYFGTASNSQCLTHEQKVQLSSIRDHFDSVLNFEYSLTNGVGEPIPNPVLQHFYSTIDSKDSCINCFPTPIFISKNQESTIATIDSDVYSASQEGICLINNAKCLNYGAYAIVTTINLYLMELYHRDPE
jgi:hypothetical protein